MRYIMLALILALTGGPVMAHQWLPTYPELRRSYVPDVYVTTLELFNSRADVEYYEIKVYDKDFEPVKFATASRIINVEHLKRKKVDIYIKEEDKTRAVYICSKSKHIADNNSVTIVSSRICSKIK